MPETRVVNVKQANAERPRWRDDPSYVYIGRQPWFRTALTGYGNPFSVAEWGREGAIQMYEEMLDAGLDWRLNSDAALKHNRERIRVLHGKTLVCHCAPAPCHGDVLKRMADLMDLMWEEQK